MTSTAPSKHAHTADVQSAEIAKERIELHRAYRFRLYPTSAQDAELSEWLRQLRWLYNLAQEQRLAALGRPRGEQPRVDYFRQAREMTELTHADPQLQRVVCSARQEVLRDLDKAWQRWRKGLGGRPRFKRRTDFPRFYLSTTKHWQVMPGFLLLKGAAASVGPISIRQDRPWPKGASFASCHITREVDEWYAVFPLVFSAEMPEAKTRSVGINRGVVHAIADSDGRVVDSPAYYGRALERIAHLSRLKSRKVPGSKNAHKAAEKLARAHRKVRRQREFWLHQQSAHYARNYALVGIEDWSTREMTASKAEPDAKIRGAAKHALNRGILDVGWYELGRQIRYKGEATGARLVAVDPGLFDGEGISISSVCSVCGAPLVRPASGRVQARCDDCGHRELGDVNAARNVLLRAEAALPPAPKRPKVSIKIKGRAKAQTATTKNPSVDACGGDAPVRAPVEAGMLNPRGQHPTRTVVPRTAIGHPPHEDKES